MERSINTYSAFDTGPDPFFDGRVDNLDAHFSQLRLWRDLNQDCISQGEELFTLGQEGIAALLVAKKENAVVLNNGNQLADLGGYIRTDGSSGTLGVAEQLADIDLANDPFYSQFTDHIPFTEATRALPDMQRSGMVRSLREAASLQTPEGAELATKLAEYSAVTTRAEQLVLYLRVCNYSPVPWDVKRSEAEACCPGK